MASTSGQFSARYVSVPYLICLIVTIAILFTDKNLQTDFGTVSPYFIHWYGLLVTAVVDVIAVAVLAARSSRGTVKLSAVVSIILALFLMGDIALYKSVGFSTPQQFATYLFGFTHYQGNTQYIPGLYDALFAFYIIAFMVSLAALRGNRKASKS